MPVFKSLVAEAVTTQSELLSTGLDPRHEAQICLLAGDAYLQWKGAIGRLENAGYGVRISRCYVESSIKIAEIIGVNCAIELADAVSVVAIKSGPSAAEALCSAVIVVARNYSDQDSFSRWLRLMGRLSSQAPESTVFVLKRVDMLTSRLHIGGLEAWVWSGMRCGENDAVARLNYFKLLSTEAMRVLAREAGDAKFSDFLPGMTAYLAALYGLDLKIMEAIPSNFDAADFRPTFSHGVIRLPTPIRGLASDAQKTHYRASLAHIGAHYAYSTGRLSKGSLRPIQIATVSIIEDARVEHLAMRDMPGLRRLWQPLHRATYAQQTAPNLMACLARSLIDPEFDVENSWVQKGRTQFFAAQDQWHDQDLSRRIGNILGNDLGQMRVQLNARNYVVQPAYRDDNLGIWDFGDAPLANSAETMELPTEAVKVTRKQQTSNGETRNSKATEKDQIQKARSAPEAAIAGQFLARYPEFDFETGRERPDWTTIKRYEPQGGSDTYLDKLRFEQGPLIARVKSLIMAGEPGDTRKVKRQIDGDALDLDACITAMTHLQMGQIPDPGIYEKRVVPNRQLAVNVLLDISQSTNEIVSGDAGTILDMEVEAVAVLACAMEEAGDRFAISAFCSDGREDIRIYPIKQFGEPVSIKTGAALSGLRSGYSTRMGAAIRQAGCELEKIAAHRRLVLLLSDGEPSDIDCSDPDYLVHDARYAIHALSAKGIDVFCVGLGGPDIERQISIFGRTGFIRVTDLQTLPEKLSALYLRLAR